MNGYENVSDLPEYRRISGELKFLNPTLGWCPIWMDWRPDVPCAKSLASIEELINADTTYYTFSVPTKLAADLWRQIGFQCDVKVHISRAQLAHVIDAVRNLILDWALRLEKAGVKGYGFSFDSHEAAMARTVTIHNNFNGPVAGVAQTGSTIGSITQHHASPTEIANAISSVVTALRSIDTPTVAVGEAVQDLQAIEAEVRKGAQPSASVKSALEIATSVVGLVEKIPGAVAVLRSAGLLPG